MNSIHTLIFIFIFFFVSRAPILATSIQEELVSGQKTQESGEAQTQAEKHHPILITMLCEELSIKPEQILDFELCLADMQPAVRAISPSDSALH